MRTELCGGGSGCLALWRWCLFAFPADADDFGHAGFLHGDAVEDAAGFHGFAIVSYDDKLRLRAHFADQAREAADVGLVQRRVHFVENTERTWLVAENRDEQCKRGHGF